MPIMGISVQASYLWQRCQEELSKMVVVIEGA